MTTTVAPYAMKYDGTEYYYVLNLQGDVIRIIDTGQFSALTAYQNDQTLGPPHLEQHNQ